MKFCFAIRTVCHYLSFGKSTEDGPEMFAFLLGWRREEKKERTWVTDIKHIFHGHQDNCIAKCCWVFKRRTKRKTQRREVEAHGKATATPLATFHLDH